MNKLGNLNELTNDKVSLKSAAVSVGNPHIMSVAMVMPGTLHRKTKHG